MYKPKKIIVVGGNAAGPSAAAKAKRTYPDAEVIMFEAGEFISTGTCELPYVLSGEINDYNKIVFFDEASFEDKKGVKVYTRHSVETIDRKNKEIVVKDLNTLNRYNFNYDSLVLCTGSTARSIPDVKPGQSNVFTLKSVADLVKVKDYIAKVSAGRCLIIGAGYIGLETADALIKQGINVTITDLASYPFPGSELEIQKIIAELLESHKVDFIPSANDVQYFYDGNNLTKIKHDGRIREFDFVIISAGVESNSQLAVSAKLDVSRSGGIKVDRKLRTSDSNIFAAGDNIDVVNLLTGKNEYVPQATLAHLAGHIAGANSAGGNEFMNPVVKNLAFKIFGKSFSQVGLTLKEARENYYGVEYVYTETNNLVKVMPESGRVCGKIVYSKSDKKILGASFAGDREVVGYADLISTMIYGNMHADQLANISFNYTPPLSPFINILSILGRKINKD